MGVITTQKLNTYFSEFADNDVSFNKDVVKSLALVPRQIFLKFKGGQQPCIIFSSSMKKAKVIISLSPKLIQELKDQGNSVQLRYCFLNEKDDLLSFFVQSRIDGLTIYNQDKHLYFANLVFSQRPPDDLIRILGSVLESNKNASHRSEERIILDKPMLRSLGMNSTNAKLVVDNVPRNCILRDLSFSGAKVIVLGNAKFIVNKPFLIQMELMDGTKIKIAGTVKRFEAIEGRKDICALGLIYDIDKVPMQYKLLLNSVLKKEKKS